MANPLLAPAPYDPRGGFGFQRPYIGDPYAYRREFEQPLITNGIDIPLVGGTVCLPGTYCDGPHIRGPFGTSLCYGECLPMTPGMNGDPLVPIDPQIPIVPTRPPSPAPCNGACASGYHLNKSDYFLKSGQFIRKGSACVKNRRRNPLNPRAADRAIGRLRSASAFGKYLAKISLPGRGTKRR